MYNDTVLGLVAELFTSHSYFASYTVSLQIFNFHSYTYVYKIYTRNAYSYKWGTIHCFILVWTLKQILFLAHNLISPVTPQVGCVVTVFGCVNEISLIPPTVICRNSLKSSHRHNRLDPVNNGEK